MSVKRYGIEEYQEEYPPAEMVESDDGDHVLHTDYAALEARCAGLERKTEALDIIEQEAGDANKSRKDPRVILARIENIARAGHAPATKGEGDE